MSRVLAFAAALLVAACAEMQFQRPDEQVEFELSGRIAVRFRDESSTGNFAWRHGVRNDEVMITTSLGQGVARIDILGDQETLGFRLPLAGLADWVRARAGSGPSQVRKDAQGRIVELEQSGWTIEYLEWGEDGRLPARMKLSYPGIELRLAIAQWK